MISAVLQVLLVWTSCALLSAGRTNTRGYPSVVFVLLTQPHHRHVSFAEEKAALWRKQLQALQVENSVVVTPYAHFTHQEIFTLVPLLPRLAKSHNVEEVDWFFFASEQTEVNFPILGQILRSHLRNRKSQFLGHSIHDLHPTIIHHFLLSETPHTLYYPLLPSGFALRSSLLNLAAKHVHKFSPNFHIDPVYELAVFLRYMAYPEPADLYPTPSSPPSSSVSLMPVPEFCSCDPPDPGRCATLCYKTTALCLEREQLHNVFFAVKTCQKFHKTRLPVVQQTWGATADIRVRYFSDKEDPKHLTTYSGVANVERGHCEKTMAIVQVFHSAQELSDADWLVIADDDTLLSIQHLLGLLGCYNSSWPMLLGEVYGYKAANQHGNGFLFVTGGGGIVLSRAAVRNIMNGRGCPSLEYPDDMFLGSLATELQIDMVHSPMFHQDQPSSYNPELLASHDVVSFHRHSPQDPLQVYKQYLHSKEREVLSAQNGSTVLEKSGVSRTKSEL